MATQTPVQMPNLGNEVTEAQIDLWHKQPGDRVEAGEELLSITTPKLSMDIEAPASGTLQSVEVGEDEIAEVGTTLAIIAAEEG